MKDKEPMQRSALGAVLAGFLAYGALTLLFAAICASDRYVVGVERFDPTLTALALASAIALVAFVLFLSVNSGPKPDKFEKLACLVAVGWTILWLASTAVDGDICSVRSVRSAAAYLFVPILLISLIIFGRRWMSENDD